MHSVLHNSASTAEGDREVSNQCLLFQKRPPSGTLICGWKLRLPYRPGQSYQIEQMVLTRASLKQIRESIAFWEKKVAEAEAEERGRGRNRIYHFSPHDV